MIHDKKEKKTEIQFNFFDKKSLSLKEKGLRHSGEYYVFIFPDLDIIYTVYF